MKNRKNYQDYVIRDGKFLGDFEEMYKNVEDPWNQSLTENIERSLSRQAVINFIKQNHIQSMVEFGCGLGNTTQFLHSKTGIEITGIDISKSAIKKSQKKYPDLSFKVDNALNIANYANYDCFFFSEISWYLLEDKMLNKIFELMKRFLKNKYFIHNLTFYRGQQKYGREYFTNLNEFIAFTPFNFLGKVEVDMNNGIIETSTLFKI